MKLSEHFVELVRPVKGQVYTLEQILLAMGELMQFPVFFFDYGEERVSITYSVDDELSIANTPELKDMEFRYMSDNNDQLMDDANFEAVDSVKLLRFVHVENNIIREEDSPVYHAYFRGFRIRQDNDNEVQPGMVIQLTYGLPDECDRTRGFIALRPFDMNVTIRHFLKHHPQEAPHEISIEVEKLVLWMIQEKYIRRQDDQYRSFHVGTVLLEPIVG